MLIVLPPSENKTAPQRGKPLNWNQLSSQQLNPTRQRIADALIALSKGTKKRAAETLGLGPTQIDLLDRNAALLEASAGRADQVYTGVLYEHLSVDTLDNDAKKRLSNHVAIASALFGLVRADDPIPAYRLSAGVVLPKLGTVESLWRPVLGEAMNDMSDGGLLLDLRSGSYVNLHKPTGELKKRTVTIRVLNEVNGVRKVVSHFNKATKGDIVRDLLVTGVLAVDQHELETALRDSGWVVESAPSRIDVII